jgi:hypothetical protein
MSLVGNPVVILGMGGSGLDVVARLLRRAGLYLGNHTNGPQEDALEFVEFDYLWAPTVIVGRRTARIVDLGRAGAELEACCARHTVDAPEGSAWGWKHAPSVHLLPVLERGFESLRAIHVIRDGRELAFEEGSGRTHTLRLARALLDNDPAPVTPGSPAWSGKALTRDGAPEATPLRQAAFWAALNRDAADFGETMLGDRYLRISFEALRERPSQEIPRVLAFAGVEHASDGLAAEIPEPGGNPQWWAASDDTLDGLWQVMETELRRFGYEAPGPGRPHRPLPRPGARGETPWSLNERWGVRSGAVIVESANRPDEPGADPDRGRSASRPDVASQPTISEVAWQRFDFIDLGCSKGGSLDFCRRRMEARDGVGVDIDPLKVAEARAAGVEAYVGDAANLNIESSVRFVSMMDFLEHLPSLDTVAAVLASAAQAATDFLFIVHPSFEGEEYVRLLGLQQYWHSWSGHTAHIHVSDYCQMLDQLGLHQYVIRYKHPVRDSTDSSIHTIASGRNQGPYDGAVHPAKPVVRFERQLWRSQHIVVALRAFDPGEWRDIVLRLTRRYDDGGPSMAGAAPG